MADKENEINQKPNLSKKNIASMFGNDKELNEHIKNNTKKVDLMKNPSVNVGISSLNSNRETTKPINKVETKSTETAINNKNDSSVLNKQEQNNENESAEGRSLVEEFNSLSTSKERRHIYKDSNIRTTEPIVKIIAIMRSNFLGNPLAFRSNEEALKKIIDTFIEQNLTAENKELFNELLEAELENILKNK